MLSGYICLRRVRKARRLREYALPVEQMSFWDHKPQAFPEDQRKWMYVHLPGGHDNGGDATNGREREGGSNRTSYADPFDDAATSPATVSSTSTSRMPLPPLLINPTQSQPQPQPEREFSLPSLLPSGITFAQTPSTELHHRHVVDREDSILLVPSPSTDDNESLAQSTSLLASPLSYPESPSPLSPTPIMFKTVPEAITPLPVIGESERPQSITLPVERVAEIEQIHSLGDACVAFLSTYLTPNI